MRIGRVVRAFAAALMLMSAGACLAADGPTPYPANDKDWPGKGPIRKFGWMVDNRNHFWTQREKDQGAIVFCGDSLTGGWKTLGKDLPSLKVANRGIGGDTSRGLLFRFQEDVLDLKPKAIIITIGTNDLTAHGKAVDTISNINDMLAMVEKASPELPVIVSTNPPSANPQAPVKPEWRKSLNEGIAALPATHKNVVICDLYAAMSNADGSPKEELFGKDKLHLSPAGYAKWVETISPILAKLGLNGR